MSMLDCAVWWAYLSVCPSADKAKEDREKNSDDEEMKSDKGGDIDPHMDCVENQQC